MKYLIVLLSLLTSLSLKSQTLFMAYGVKGSAFQIKSGKQNLIKIGNIFNENDSIILSSKSSVRFLCNNYKIIDLKQPGIFPLKNYIEVCEYDLASIDKTYMKFIWAQLKASHENPLENRKHFMTNVGGAVRGCQSIRLNDYFDTVRYYKGDFAIQWKAQRGITDVSVVFYDDYNAEIPFLIVPVKETHIELSTLTQKGMRPGFYYWTIKSNNAEDCPRRFIELFDEATYSNVLKLIEKNVPYESSMAERYYILAFYLELTHFYADAFELYKKASIESPGNRLYKNTVDIVKELYNFR